MIDVTTMDPIVFANTYHAVEKAALDHGYYLHYNDESDVPFEIRNWDDDHLVKSFHSVTDAWSAFN